MLQCGGICVRLHCGSCHANTWQKEPLLPCRVCARSDAALRGTRGSGEMKHFQVGREVWRVGLREGAGVWMGFPAPSPDRLCGSGKPVPRTAGMSHCGCEPRFTVRAVSLGSGVTAEVQDTTWVVLFFSFSPLFFSFSFCFK